MPVLSARMHNLCKVCKVQIKPNIKEAFIPNSMQHFRIAVQNVHIKPLTIVYTHLWAMTTQIQDVLYMFIFLSCRVGLLTLFLYDILTCWTRIPLFSITETFFMDLSMSCYCFEDHQLCSQNPKGQSCRDRFEDKLEVSCVSH